MDVYTTSNKKVCIATATFDFDGRTNTLVYNSITNNFQTTALLLLKRSRKTDLDSDARVYTN